MMHFLTPSILVFAALANASPISSLGARQNFPTVYGVDPTLPFSLLAYPNEGSDFYVLQPYFADSSSGSLSLEAAFVDNPGVRSPRANYTLIGNHYGAQLYAYYAAAGTDGPVLQWSNDPPRDNEPLTFHAGVDHPNVGMLAFYGAYHNQDFAAGEDNFLIGIRDTDFTKSFAVCDSGATKVLVYKGTDSSCVAVTVRAVQ